MASSNDVPAGKGYWRPALRSVFSGERMSIGLLFPLSLSLGEVGSQTVVLSCIHYLLVYFGTPGSRRFAGFSNLSLSFFYNITTLVLTSSHRVFYA